MADDVNMMAQITMICLIGIACSPMKPMYFVKRLIGTSKIMLRMMMMITGLLVQIGIFQGSLR